jgi:long-chain acyl-CoA synthetase
MFARDAGLRNIGIAANTPWRSCYHEALVASCTPRVSPFCHVLWTHPMQATIVFGEHTIAPPVFHDRVLRSARVLQVAGIEEGAVVALMMRNSPQMLELMLATRWLGAMWCPINWHFKTDEVQFILSDCGAKVFVCDDALLALLPELQTGSIRVFSAGHAQTPKPVSAGHACDWDTARDAAAPLTEPASAPRGPMFYTSGTTGRPKGILRVEPGMRALVNAPMYHSAPNSYCAGAWRRSTARCSSKPASMPSARCS